MHCFVLKLSSAHSLVDSIHLQRLRALWLRGPGSQTQRSATPAVQRQHVRPQHAAVQGEHRQTRRYHPGTSKLAKISKVFFFRLLTLCTHLFYLSLQARGMKRQIMDEFVSNNKFLQVPRLVNQQLFDELCPVKQFHRRRK